MRCFVSSENIDQSPAKELIQRLKEEGGIVDHSPRNPSEGKDPRWTDWYKSGLPTALDTSDVFIIVLNHVWDSSSWMSEEAHLAMESPTRRHVDHVFYWNPLDINVTARGMLGYLRIELPHDLESLVAELRRVSAA